MKYLMSHPTGTDSQARHPRPGEGGGNSSKQEVVNSSSKQVVVKESSTLAAGAAKRLGDPHSSQEDEKTTNRQVALEEACGNLPVDYEPVLDAWAEIAVRHPSVSQVVANSIKMIRKAKTGVLFKDLPDFKDVSQKYHIRQIVLAIKRFGQMRNEVAWLPDNKKPLMRVTLDKFFLNQFGGNKSWFATCIRNGLKRAGDHNPEMTAQVIEKFAEMGKGKIDYDTAINISSAMHRYFEKQNAKLKKIGVRSEKNLIAKWFSFLHHEIDDWGPQHFLAKGMSYQFEKFVR